MYIQTQTLLDILIIVLLVTLIGAVIYLIFILKELRLAVKKANMTLDSINQFSTTLANPTAAVVSVIKSFAEVFKTVKSVKNSMHRKE